MNGNWERALISSPQRKNNDNLHSFKSLASHGDQIVSHWMHSNWTQLIWNGMKWNRNWLHLIDLNSATYFRCCLVVNQKTNQRQILWIYSEYVYANECAVCMLSSACPKMCASKTEYRLYYFQIISYLRWPFINKNKSLFLRCNRIAVITNTFRKLVLPPRAPGAIESEWNSTAYFFVLLSQRRFVQKRRVDWYLVYSTFAVRLL